LTIRSSHLRLITVPFFVGNVKVAPVLLGCVYKHR